MTHHRPCVEQLQLRVRLGVKSPDAIQRTALPRPGEPRGRNGRALPRPARCSSAASSCSAMTPSSALPRARATSSPRSSCARSPPGTSGARTATRRPRRAPPPATRSASTPPWSPPARCSSTTPSASSTSARPPWPTPASGNAGGMIAMLGGDGRRRARPRRAPGPRGRQRQRPGPARAQRRRRRARPRPRTWRRDEAGARARRLDVTGAFHSPLMEPAAERLRAALDATPVAEPQHPGLLQRQRGALRRRAPRAGREPAAPRALARDAAGAAHRARRALRRARPRLGAHRPRQANPAGGA